MLIDDEACIGCEICVPYCAVGAIGMSGDVATIDRDACVECGVCKRVERCPTEAFVKDDLEWPRTVRQVFSDPTAEHEETRIAGRGTEEIKTNDVTGRIGGEEVGINLEFGRPGVSTALQEVEIVASAIADDVKFEPQNPLTSLMVDSDSGRLNDEVRDERVMSAILEFTATVDEVPGILEAIDDAAAELDTVLSVNGSYRIGDEDAIEETPLHDVIDETSFEMSINGKTNVGMGNQTVEVPSAVRAGDRR